MAATEGDMRLETPNKKPTKKKATKRKEFPHQPVTKE